MVIQVQIEFEEKFDRPILSAAKYRPMILVSRNIIITYKIGKLAI